MFNLGKCLELALNNGKCLLCGEQAGPETGDPRDFTSIEDVFQAYEEQVAYFVKHMVIAVNAIDLAHKDYVQTPYLSLLVSDCLEEGKDITEAPIIISPHPKASGWLMSLIPLQRFRSWFLRMRASRWKNW
jgi:formate C-acetyltransferase